MLKEHLLMMWTTTWSCYMKATWTAKIGHVMVLSLCGRVGDLEHLVQHQTLMGALG